MFKKSLNVVLGKPLCDALLDSLSARPAAALLVTPFVHLWIAGPTPILPTNLPADFTEATFAGYAAVAWTLPLAGPVNLDPTADGCHNDADFVAGAIVTPQNVLGYWIDEAAVAGTKMYFAETFPAPIPFVNPGDFLSLDAIACIFKELTVPGA